MFGRNPSFQTSEERNEPNGDGRDEDVSNFGCGPGPVKGMGMKDVALAANDERAGRAVQEGEKPGSAGHSGSGSGRRPLDELAGPEVVHLFERDPDQVQDCFLFVCERLRSSRHILRGGMPGAPGRKLARRP